ncbi:MAG TPA: hydroxyisourate hydrolase [Pyrinomonadaceae bacterium]|jgi:5-hydroxyisourate hydrolase
MSAITTHVLDTSRGRPASGLAVVLEMQTDEHDWRIVGRGATDDDGRLRNLLPDDVSLEAATYRLRFDTGGYFSSQNLAGFYPEVAIIFRVHDAAQHYHVPLLLSPFGYSTYRGS